MNLMSCQRQQFHEGNCPSKLRGPGSTPGSNSTLSAPRKLSMIDRHGFGAYEKPVLAALEPNE